MFRYIEAGRYQTRVEVAVYACFRIDFLCYKPVYLYNCGGHLFNFCNDFSNINFVNSNFA